MKKSKIFALILTVVMIMGTMGLTAFAAEEIQVSTAVDFYNAINNAVSGDVISLTEDVTYEGQWKQLWNKENLTINGNGKTITFTGEVVSGTNGSYLIHSATNLTVKDLTIIFAENDTTSKGFYALGGRFENCNFSNGNLAICIVGDVDFINCNFSNLSDIAIYSDDSGNTNGTEITGCTFTDTRAYIARSNEVISDNKIVCDKKSEVALAMTIAPNAEATVSNNLLEEGTQLELYDSTSTISQNQILGTVYAGETLTNTTMESNTLSEAAESALESAGLDVDSVDPVAEINGKKYFSVQSAVDSAKEGTTEIQLLPGTIEENVFILQQEGINIVIKGSEDVIYKGGFEICGNNRSYTMNNGTGATETLTFDGINFNGEDKTESHDFIGSTRKNTLPSGVLVWAYPHNVTVKNCNFVGNYQGGDYDGVVSGDVVALRNVGGYNWTVENCTAKGLHSFMQASANTLSSKIDNLTVTQSKSGLNLGTNANYTITNSTFDVLEYAIRTDANSDRDVDLVIKECNFTGENALIVRKADSANFTYDVAMNNNKIVTTGAGIVRKDGKDADTITFDYGFNYWNGGEAKVEGLSEASIVASLPYYIDEDMTVIGGVEAKIGDTYYATIQEAIEAAKTVTDPVIEILAGTYNGFNVPKELNNVTFVGEKDAEGNNLVTIRTLEEDVESFTGGVYVQAETATFKNLNFTAGTTIKNDRVSWMTSSLGRTNSSSGSADYLKDLTVENCNFAGSGTGWAIWTTQAEVKVINSTITNYANGISAFNLQGTKTMTIEGTKITDVTNAIHTSGNGGNVVVKDTEIDSELVELGAQVNVSISNSKINNATFVTRHEAAVVTVSDTSFINAVISEEAKGTYNDVKIEVDADGNSTYDAAIAAVAANNEINANIITVKFEQTMKNGKWVEGSYDINLYGNGDGIYEFVSAELKFDKTGSMVESGFENKEMNYNVYGTENISVTKNLDENHKATYAFYLNALDANGNLVTRPSGNKVTIGKVVFDGKGTMKLEVVGDASKVVTTKKLTNDEKYYTVDDAKYRLDVSDIINSNEVMTTKRNVRVNIEFEHDINAGVAEEYKFMTVTLKDSIGSPAITKTVTIEDINNGYVEFADKSEEGGIDESVTIGVITVTLKAPGFRTYTYQTTMEDTTDEFVLNFWNSVLRDKTGFIEAGQARSEMAHNFLVGDIAMDYIIDKYDLAAVTSYYGIYDIDDSEDAKYIEKHVKYDLNRDGQIDILDVAYVLHGMGN